MGDGSVMQPVFFCAGRQSLVRADGQGFAARCAHRARATPRTHLQQLRQDNDAQSPTWPNLTVIADQVMPSPTSGHIIQM
jgi:hypothetical protein